LGFAGYMLWSFLAENYSLTWVAKYTDASLPVSLRVAAIWAGQEGTLLLWLLALVAITWTYLWGRVSKVLLGEQFLLLLGLLLLNPLAQSGIDSGMGLNPLLRTSWMLYHPPVVFIGYALLTVPFAEGLLGEKGPGKKYLHLGWLMLGTGLALGGFWAYGVLGWGGFWSWDPVEAASLVPWLLATVALHLYHRDRGRPFTIPTVLLTLWALRHSLQRDGTARSLAHFGVILFLIGVVASSQYSSSQTVSLESGAMQELGEIELRQAELVKPVIWRQLWQDIYISPLSVGDRGGEIVTRAVALVGVDRMGTEVTLQLYSPGEAESLLVAEVSTKPLMNFVRFGVLLTLLGGLATFIEHVLTKRD
ncbi:MAG: cytochrome c biogenesis protein CcsA, partial [Bacillota bacterium]|nr:cytochrome c biogenesis protein CcsA [Bacillota bacterium]